MKANTAAKNIALIAVMSAILIVGKFALSFVPNVEVITPLIIIFTCVFGFKRVIFAVAVFCLLDNFIYTFNYLVTLQYFFHWPLLCLLSHLCHKIFGQNLWAYAVLTVAMGLLFWIETAVLYEIFGIMKFKLALIAGGLFLVAMVISGTCGILIFYKPLYKLLGNIRI